MTTSLAEGAVQRGSAADCAGIGPGSVTAPISIESVESATDRVTVTTDAVHVEHFVCRDPDVVAAAQTSSDPGRAVEEMLLTGARVLRFASASVDAGVLERTVADLEQAFQARLDATMSTLEVTTKSLLDPETGSIPGTLNQVRDEIAKKLGDTFDPQSTTSALSIIDGTLGRHKADINRDVRRLLDATSPDSPLAGLEARLREMTREQAKELREAAEKIREAVVVERTRTEMAEKTTAKGFSYEDLVEGAVERIAAVHGDRCVNVGRDMGVAGSDKGDLLVTLSPDDCAGQELRFVLECKDQSLSKPRVRAELEDAIDNGRAAAGVLVFASEDASPFHLPFSYSGNQAVVVYDRQHPDEQVLQVAYAWARWMTRRAQSADDALDAEAFLAALRDAEAGLAKKTQVLTGLTQATNGIEMARKAVEALADQVAEGLGQMRSALDP